MSSFTPEQREAIMREAREHLPALKDWTPRQADVLADLNENVVRFLPRPEGISPEFRRNTEPDEPEPERPALAESDITEIVAAVATETVSRLDEHREYLHEVLVELIRGVLDRQADQADTLRAEVQAALTTAQTDIERLRAELIAARTDTARLAVQVGSLTAEINKKSAAEFAKSDAATAVIKH